MPSDLPERVARLESQMERLVESVDKNAEHVDVLKHQRSWLMGGVAGFMLLITIAGTLATSTVVSEIREAKELQTLLMKRMGQQVGTPTQVK